MSIAKKLKKDINKLELSQHELKLAADVLDPTTMETRFVDIGGLDNLKKEIYELSILPMREQKLFRAAPSLVKRPSGILLYGQPGCGKTMLARAIAKESRAFFLPIHSSSLVQKFMGESTKLVKAAFTLARKLSPSIVFFDEVDLIMGKGSSDDGGSAARERSNMKAELLAFWDGISTNREHAVLVIGATNHPDNLDKAMLRRFSRSFHIPLPDATGREEIMRSLLHDQPMDVSAEQFLPRLAGRLTEGYSGSDLKELCRAAAFEPVREKCSQKTEQAVMKKGGQDDPNELDEFAHGKTCSKEEDQPNAYKDEEEPLNLRPLKEQDFQTALSKVKRTGQAAEEYRNSCDSAPDNTMYI